MPVGQPAGLYHWVVAAGRDDVWVVKVFDNHQYRMVFTLDEVKGVGFDYRYAETKRNDTNLGLALLYNSNESLELTSNHVSVRVGGQVRQRRFGYEECRRYRQAPFQHRLALGACLDEVINFVWLELQGCSDGAHVAFRLQKAGDRERLPVLDVQSGGFGLG